MAQASHAGRFVWHELLTTDTAAAARFYSDVVGWKSQPWSQDPNYTLLLAGKQMVGGIMTLPEEAKAMGAPPNWLTYVGAANVDETVSRLEALGGSVRKAAWDIPNVGRIAIVSDPQGAVFGLYAPLQPQPAGGDPKAGEFSWHELMTTDQAAAFAFYQELFGWQKTRSMDMGPMGSYDIFGWDGKERGGMMRLPPGVPVACWLPYVMVRDSKKSAAATTRLGGQVINGPMEVPGGDWIAQGTDLQGAVFAVHSRKPEPPAAKKAAAAPAAKAPAAKAPAAKAPAAKAPAAKVPAAKAARPARKAAKKARPARRAAKKAPARKAAKAGRAAKKGKARKAGRKARKARGGARKRRR